MISKENVGTNGSTDFSILDGRTSCLVTMIKSSLKSTRQSNVSCFRHTKERLDFFRRFPYRFFGKNMNAYLRGFLDQRRMCRCRSTKNNPIQLLVADNLGEIAVRWNLAVRGVLASFVIEVSSHKQSKAYSIFFGQRIGSFFVDIDYSSKIKARIRLEDVATNLNIKRSSRHECVL